MPDLADFETLIARLAAIDFSQTSEQATREMAVNPVIGALGWDTFDPGEVAREYPVRGGKVDYCLRGPMSALALIEVKRTGQELSEHQEQLLGYAFREGAPLAALTDGLVWWLYLPRAGGSWEQRRFYSIDFREQDAARAASAMRRFLSREGVVGGTAQKEAQREFDSQERERRASAIVRATRATAATASSAGAGAYLAPAAVLLAVLERFLARTNMPTQPARMARPVKDQGGHYSPFGKSPINKNKELYGRTRPIPTQISKNTVRVV